MQCFGFLAPFLFNSEILFLSVCCAGHWNLGKEKQLLLPEAHRHVGKLVHSIHSYNMAEEFITVKTGTGGYAKIKERPRL